MRFWRLFQRRGNTPAMLTVEQLLREQGPVPMRPMASLRRRTWSFAKWVLRFVGLVCEFWLVFAVALIALAILDGLIAGVQSLGRADRACWLVSCGVSEYWSIFWDGYPGAGFREASTDGFSTTERYIAWGAALVLSPFTGWRFKLYRRARRLRWQLKI